jgi:hypothetical protein
MSQIENHWDEVSQIETELRRYMMALGLDWHDEAAMSQLASDAQAAYTSHDSKLINKAKFFGLVSTMMRTMESAARENRDVHGGEVWKAFGKHLYR